jgi:hypothetical protein
MDPDKREIRKLKRAIKKAGNKRRRQSLKRNLERDPEGAADHEADVGRHASADWNGQDHDATRRRDED